MQLLHLDEHLAVLNKPAGLLVHRSAIDRHETRFALQLARDQLGRRVYPVHRLDKPVAGALLFALTAEAAARMTELFTNGGVCKRYLAVVRGNAPKHDVIDYPLVEEHDRMTDRLAQQDKPAQAAVTEYHCLAQAELPYVVGRYPTSRYSLLQVLPRTGRKHQIRRHMKHIFHPIVGDTTHGDGKHNQFFREHFACQRLLLAATGMVFTHPYSGQTLDIAAPLDEGFQEMLAALGWAGIAAT